MTKGKFDDAYSEPPDDEEVCEICGAEAVLQECCDCGNLVCEDCRKDQDDYSICNNCYSL